MSFPKAYRLVLSPKAERDIEQILRYTEETWGEAQAVVYHQLLDDALRRLLEGPGEGRGSADMPKTPLALPVGSHVVVYRVQGDTIGVVRVLHQRMSLPLHV